MQISPLEASAARQSFALFFRLVFQTLHHGRDLDDNWHIDAICHAFERAWKGEVSRLAIAVAPRALKSMIASVAFPLFLIGHNPACRIICASYSRPLAQKFQLDFRRVLDSDWYRQVFPDAAIAPIRDTGEEIVTAAGGYRYATSVGSTLTGRGADYFIIDDPINAIDAHSENARQTVRDWYVNAAYSRLDSKEKGFIGIAMQRLHPDDLIGHSLAHNPEEWEYLCLPSIAPRDITYRTGWMRSHVFRAGEALHPQRESLAQLERIRKEIGSGPFSAQYLQEPLPPEGMLVQRKYLQFYDGIPDLSRAIIRQSWDTAAKTALENDWSVCVTVAEINGCHHVLDVFRAKLTFPDLLSKAIELHRRYGPRRLLVEDTGIGTSLIAILKRERINAVGVKAVESKANRLRAQLPNIEAGRLLLPSRAHWLQEFISELLGFPSGRHDDQVDALTQAMADEYQDVTVTVIDPFGNVVRSTRQNTKTATAQPIRYADGCQVTFPAASDTSGYPKPPVTKMGPRLAAPVARRKDGKTDDQT
jgi:predicted phage terminase large subunit-like protein